jgi:hypothetical protein
MKKAIALISFVLYFAFTCGIVITSHYCMKRLVSISVFQSKSDRCGKCGMDIHEGENNCCKDETCFVKLVLDQNKIPYTVYSIPSLEPLAAEVSDHITCSLYNIDERRHFHNHSPPLLSAQDTYLQNGVFRI